MSDDALVLQLVEDALDSGRTPEQVCAESPELLPAVRARWEFCRRLSGHLGDLFPCPDLPGNSADVDGPDKSSRTEETNRDADGSRELPSVRGYAVEKVLGHGGVGVVYLARDLGLRRPVALKMLLSGAYASQVERARFLRESRVVATLRHPNVVQVYDVGEHDALPYFTMELMDGGSMAEWLAGVPRPPAEAAALIRTIAGAIEAAHRAGIVHRDLKPANVLLMADGTPKVSDFGLARQDSANEEVALTASGARLGTPSYMAPEQAAGRRGAVGPATDVYALGAILYETLTGRPPFRGDSAAETERQVIAEEPVPPRRLNAKVPRDLDTICLKCLSKEPRRRYPTAAALADDLGRFLRGEPIAARRTGLPERAGKWVRRRPAAAVAVAATLLISMAAVGGGLWLVSQHAAMVRAVESDLDEVVEVQRDANWPAAKAALGRARDRLGARGPKELRRRLDLAARDNELVDRLDAIRVTRAGAARRPDDPSDTDQDYLAVFGDVGLADIREDPAVVGARAGESNVVIAVVAGLDDWAFCTPNSDRRGWLLKVLRRADADPTGWRGKVRDPAVWGDGARLAEVLKGAPVDDQPAAFLLAAARQVSLYGRDARPFLAEVQRAHPNDFWASMALAAALHQGSDAVGVLRYSQAAVAARPEVPAGHNALGSALLGMGKYEEAVSHYQRGLRIDPNMNAARVNLGLALANMGRHAEAIRETAEAVRRAPGRPVFRCRLGDLLVGGETDDDALDHYLKAIALDPKLAATEAAMRTTLTRRGRGEDVRSGWRQALEAPPNRNTLDQLGAYAEYCLFLSRDDAYLAVRPALLEGLAANGDPRAGERAGRTCLLLPPGSDDELRRATAAVDAALEADKTAAIKFTPYFLFAKGLAEYRAGRTEVAVQILEGPAAPVLGPAPKLVAAMARHRLGQTDAAREALARAVLALDWSAAGAAARETWMFHALRREAEAMILPDLPAFLAGAYQPKDQVERIAFLAVCQAKERHLAAARLYVDVFAADPRLAEDVTGGGHRYRAAVAAHAAGCGRGADAAGLDDEARTRWRKQAREWLWADLAAWRRRIASGPAADRAEALARLTWWRLNPDLSELRTPAARAEFPRHEQQEYVELWDALMSVLNGAMGTNAGSGSPANPKRETAAE